MLRALASLVLLLGDEPRVTQVAIDAAIERGVTRLRAQYRDGSGTEGRAPARAEPGMLTYPGLRALTAYTLLKSGAPLSDPTVQALFGRLAFERFDTTYDA